MISVCWGTKEFQYLPIDAEFQAGFELSVICSRRKHGDCSEHDFRMSNMSGLINETSHKKD